MPFQKIKRSQIEDEPSFGYDLEVAHTLSAAGWVYEPDTICWRLGQHVLSVEGLDIALMEFAGTRQRILRALREGAVGYTFDVDQETTVGVTDFTMTLRFTWPDAVTRLGKVADA